MLKNISNLGTVLNAKEQQLVKGGVRGSQPWEMCWRPEEPCQDWVGDGGGGTRDCLCE